MVKNKFRLVTVDTGAIKVQPEKKTWRFSADWLMEAIIAEGMYSESNKRLRKDFGFSLKGKTKSGWVNRKQIKEMNS